LGITWPKPKKKMGKRKIKNRKKGKNAHIHAGTSVFVIAAPTLMPPWGWPK